MKPSKTHTLSVGIMDKDYQVACPPEEQSDLLEAAQYLDKQMRSIRSGGKVIGTERIAVMAALNITYELLQGGNTPSGAGTSSSSNQQLKRLTSKLDKALEQLKQLEV